MTWKILFPLVTPEHLGLIPDIIRADDPRPVQTQIAERYAHGGGWSPYADGDWELRPQNGFMRYKGDDLWMEPLAQATVNGEQVRFYDMALVSVVHTDGSFHVLRMD
jgi:hypothetical protein